MTTPIPRQRILLKIVFGACLLLAGLAAYYQLWFLRQPVRNTPIAPDCFISPANGVIAAVVQWDADSLAWEKDAGVVQVLTDEIGEKGWLIAIEMDVTNVHYQRAPANARMLKTSYTKGRFNNALVQTNRFGLRLENERNEFLFEHENGMKFKVVQVAGLLARRIVSLVDDGNSVGAGEVIGLIKLGSQVGLVLPENIAPTVSVGETVIDGETIVAKIN